MQEKTYFQIKINANDIKPQIYRTIIVDSTKSFITLHKYIQNAFGFENYHLWQFSTDFRNFKGNGVKLYEIFKEEKDKINYTYDFGDNWEFTLTLEKIITESKLLTLKLKNKKPPFLLKAKGPMLIEDCGGIYTIAEILNLYEFLLKDDKEIEKEEIEDLLYSVMDPEDSEDWEKEFMEIVEALFEIDLENFKL